MIHCTFEDGGEAKLRHVTVTCLVVKENAILLGRRNQKLSEGGKWGPLGGFMERDETTAQTAVRETMEESGWEIENLRLFRINDNPDRPREDRQNIDFVYIADAVEQTGTSDWETDEVRWFKLDELPADEAMAFDHAENIALYKAYLEQPFPIPFLGPISSK